ncbi:hypothetical protein [Streptococcus ovis]|uniref:hypothetical protein n=1 Tax=Streptococcus ovis TaxID=82806 RepID=UPI000371876E|nr:hypothetical protein [Streptococcus ovis]
MAFEPQDDKIRDILNKSVDLVQTSGIVSNLSDNFERTKQFQFTLQPSVREKINQLAKESGYRSASAFINDYFKKL